MIENGIYRKVIVVGGDLLSHFITSGFLSFRSLSSRPCRPYDSNRDGLNLGEACGAVLLSTEKTPNSIILSGGAISNDANHISGPSRTGDGLFFAIRQAMQEAGTALQTSALSMPMARPPYTMTKWNPKPSRWLIWNKFPHIA